MYFTGDLLGENESSSTNILQSWTHRKGILTLCMLGNCVMVFAAYKFFFKTNSFEKNFR